MAYIHSLKNWPCFTWDTTAIAPLLAQVRYQQGCFAGAMAALPKDIATDAQAQVLLADVAASCELENVYFDPQSAEQAIKGLITGRKNAATTAPNGLIEVLAQIYTSPPALLTAGQIFKWNALITGQNNAPCQHWRQNEAKDIIFGPKGHEKVQYTAPKAELLPQMMQTFLAWFNFNNAPTPNPLWHDPLIKAAIAHFWFISIHPFEDGSARLARAISDLALLQADSGKAYYSLSLRMLHERKEYFAALSSAQQNNLDISAWLIWYLHATERAVNTAEKLISSPLRKQKARNIVGSTPLNPRQQQVLQAFINKELTQINSGLYATITGCSTDTALRDIQELMKLKLLRQNSAGGRSTSYSAKI